MTIALTAIQTPKLSSQEREHGFVQGLPKPDSKKTHTDQSETQPKSCSVHLFIKDSKNPITILRSAAEAKPVNLDVPFEAIEKEFGFTE